ILTSLATIIGGFIGVSAGLLAAVSGQMLDGFLSRCVDAIMSVPPLILALLVLSSLGVTVWILIMTVSVIEATRIFRVTRAAGRDIAVLDYIEVARLRGESSFRIMYRDVFPNIMPPV